MQCTCMLFNELSELIGSSLLLCKFRLDAMTSHKSPQELVALYRDFGVASKVLTREEASVCAKLCEVGKAYLWAKARSLVAKAAGKAVLYSYSSDGTPLLAQSTTVASLDDGRRRVRKAGHAVEFLMEKAFLTTKTHTGQKLVQCLFRDPVQLSSGKTAWHAFTAACQFFPMLRTLGHTGIAVSHYAFDRALYSTLARRMHQRHGLYYKVTAHEANDGLVSFEELTDWVVTTGCASHDTHNALKWALSSVVPDAADTVKKLFIVVESLRNSYDLLLGHLPSFLTKHLVLVDEGPDPMELRGLWTALGLDTDLCQTLADLGLLWVDGHLQCCRRRVKGDLVEKVHSCLIAATRFRKFTDSRWCTIGASCGTIVACRLLGLDHWVEVVRSNPNASDFYIHGYGQLDDNVCKYATIASMVAPLADGVLLELLKDDRVVRQLPVLQAIVEGELQWLASLGPYAWERLATLQKGYTAHALRTDCLLAANTAGAFIERRVFSAAKQLPWSLASGDIRANLAALKAKEPQDIVSKKIKQLIAIGFNEGKLVDGISLLQEVRWSTTPVEQSHGSSAALRRFHRQYGAEMVAKRSMVHMMKPLFAASGVQEQWSTPRKQANALVYKQPQRITGRHVFLAEAMEAASHKSPDGKIGHNASKEVMAKHGVHYKQLPEDLRLDYEAKAVQKRLSQLRSQDEVFADLAPQVARQAAQVSEAAHDEGTSSRVSQCILSNADEESLAAVWNSEDFSRRQVEAMRRAAQVAPQVPAVDVQERLLAIEAPPVGIEHTVSQWCRDICHLRTHFQGCALVFLEDGVMSAYAFILAIQKPFAAAFMPLTLVPEAVPPLTCQGLQAMHEACGERSDYTFSFQWGKYIFDHEMGNHSAVNAHVLTQLYFSNDNHLCSHADLMGLSDFLAAFPKAPEPSKRQETDEAVTTPALQADLLQKHPWLKQYADAKLQAMEEANEESGEDVAIPVYRGGPRPMTLSSVEVDQVMDEMKSKRLEWEHSFPNQGENFTSTLMGGTWTKQYRGMVCERTRAFAVGKNVEAWCLKYSLPTNMSFTFSKYGQALAGAFAVYFCKRLQYFYDIAQNSGETDHVFTSAELGNPPAWTNVLEQLRELPDTHPGYLRLTEILDIVPKAPASNASSSSRH